MTAMRTTTTARMLTMKEMDGNIIPPGDTAKRNGTHDGGGRALDNDKVEYDNVGPGGGGLSSMIDDEDN
jgi:hypothetical protein